MKDLQNRRKAEEGSAWKVEIRLGGHLDGWMMDYFDGLTLSHQDDGTTFITGELPDKPAVFGLILELRDAGIDLISLQVKRG